jgi:hypothetical protein
MERKQIAMRCAQAPLSPCTRVYSWGEGQHTRLYYRSGSPFTKRLRLKSLHRSKGRTLMAALADNRRGQVSWRFEPLTPTPLPGVPGRGERYFQSFNLSIFQSFNLSIFQSFNLAISQSRNLAISQSRNLAVSQFRSFAVSQFRSFVISQSLACITFSARARGAR